MKRVVCLAAILLVLLSTSAFGDSITISLTPNIAGDNVFYSERGPGGFVAVNAGTERGYYDYNPPGYAPGTTLGGNGSLFFSSGFASVGGYSSELSFLSGTLFLTTFTLPTNGKEFTVPVELSISGSGILDNGEVFGFGGGKRGKITFDYVDSFYLPGNFVPAPEPGTIVLMGSGLIGVVALLKLTAVSRAVDSFAIPGFLLRELDPTQRTEIAPRRQLPAWIHRGRKRSR